MTTNAEEKYGFQVLEPAICRQYSLIEHQVNRPI
jgi:hypothetical protein